MASVRGVRTDADGLRAESAPLSLADVLSGIEADYAAGRDGGSGVYPTGFGVLDHMLDGGLRAGHLILVGGPPGVGKTVATLQWARNAAAAGHPALYVCYEHSERELFSRVLLTEMGALPTSESNGQLAAEARRVLRAVTRAERSLKDEIAGNLPLRAACSRVATYDDRLALVRAGIRTGVHDIERMLTTLPAKPQVVFVDYLQKIAVAADSDGERPHLAAEALKEMALTHDVAVVAVVAGDDAGLGERRQRMRHIEGGAPLAYEADVIVMLNEKFHAVSRAHTAHDPVAAQRFLQRVVFTIEKNREGPVALHAEFEKDFEHSRFVPQGAAVEEHLVDDHYYRE